MPISLSKIASNVSTVKIAYGGETVTINYYPSRITEKTFAQLQGFSQMNEDNITENFAAFNDLLVHIIKSWDIYEDDEETVMFPLDAERLAELPIALRSFILQSIMNDIRPEAMTPQAMSNGSR